MRFNHEVPRRTPGGADSDVILIDLQCRSARCAVIGPRLPPSPDDGQTEAMTMPFEFLDRKQTKLTLRVVGATSWEVVHGFRYVDQYDDDNMHTVPDGFGPTDLTSVPLFLQWLVRSYGKHTNAALVHDVYWDDDVPQATLRKANMVFRHAMWESGVPWLRRWFMWSAVTLAMLAKTPLGAVRVGAWALALVVASAGFLASHDVVLSQDVCKVAAVVVGVIMVAAAMVGLFARTRTATDSPGSKTALTKISRTVAVGAAGILIALAVFRFVGASDVADNNGGWLAVAALAVGLLAWGDLIAAGVFATIEVAIIALPVAGIAVGLVLYGALEGIMIGVLKLGRLAKGASGRQPIGTLNPLASRKLEATPPPANATVQASKL